MEKDPRRDVDDATSSASTSRRDFLHQAAGLTAGGGTMHWLCLGKPDWEQHPEHIADAARHKPIGISPHGSLNERLHRQKKYDVLTGLLKRIRDQGVLVGLSAHDPTLIEEAIERDWDVDYFMTSRYYLTRPKAKYKKLLSEDWPM